MAKGYGLADLSENDQVLARPAFQALRQFLLVLGNARFVRAEIPPQKDERHGRYLFWFECESGEQIALCWNHGIEECLPADIEYTHAEGILGEAIDGRVRELSGSPVYLRQCTLPR